MNYIRTFEDNSKLLIEGNRLSTFDYHMIGEVFGGGMVFYTWSGGTHGYIVGAPGYSALSRIWGCKGASITTPTSIGSGKQNTTNIVTICPTADIAAKIATGYTIGGYTDWYLPSRDEALQIVNVAFLTRISNNFWTSSQVDANNAYIITVNNYTASSYDKNTGGNMVLPIREF